ncbi:PLP-dependent aminotransferase family protein [Photobacterium sp. DA100]|uniref:aminotransferase-like domain-containing protein n=1 Tax=Photobacterium sp. DA100 TaxID=3027472 RepID=UPI002478AB69|nr:PLP-dependent aminotransferase family protein [Photobacterium sp. DA100]WEM41941.1 PLP-dependent aminotransferase family protein [Photobacterium sp. DA100]
MPSGREPSPAIIVIELIKQQINQQVWLPGERIPSIRKMSQLQSISPMTVMKAYEQLELDGWIYAKPKSGYFVSPHFNQLLPTPPQQPQVVNQSININRHVFEVMRAIKQPDVIPFGSAFPDPSLFPMPTLGRLLSRTVKTMPYDSGITDLAPGCESLRRAISQRYAKAGINVSAEQVVITSGATEALGLGLAAVTQPGDMVVIESPAFYGALQTIERLHLKAVEIPVCPTKGLDTKALDSCLERYPIKACWLMSNFQNPTGVSLAPKQQRAVYDLLAARNVAIIEDDVYGELYYGTHKPPCFKAIDSEGLVIHCSSFSKSLAPGFRVGWALAGRFTQQVTELQFMSTLSAPVPNQHAIASYIKEGVYDSHLRQLRRTLVKRQQQMIKAIHQLFPAGTTVTKSDGGYFVWVALPFDLDSSELLTLLLERYRISIAPGTLFSSGKQYRHCIRINSSYELSAQNYEALKALAQLLSSHKQ